MNLILYIKQGFSSILSNKFRSFLSILGIVIGISSVVIMLAIGEGAKQSILSTFDNIDNLITIAKNYNSPSTPTDGKSKDKEIQPVAKDIFNFDVADSIISNVPNIISVSYYGYLNVYGLMYKSQWIGGSSIGVSQDYLKNKKYKIKYGNYFTKKNFQDNQKVVILGGGIVRDYFGKINPLGKKINASGSDYMIVGILEKNYKTDYNIYFPITTAKKGFGLKQLENIDVFVTNKSLVKQTKKDLQFYLFKRSQTLSPQNVGFIISTNDDALKQVNQIVGKMRLLLAVIGSIALIVGGIGIMNIMLVSVTERTREIGIRKSIGATKTNILFQFLIESIILSFLGGIIAIGSCYGFVILVNKFLPEFKPVISISVLMIASLVSILMGIIFGIIPAWKAARLKPIDALRYE